MAIGKNAIKRVENNGYSNVKTTAPDMENSTVIAKPDEQVVEKLVKPVGKAAAKKTTVKKAPAKKSTEKKVPAKKAETPLKDGFARVSVGEDMPYHLL